MRGRQVDGRDQSHRRPLRNDFPDDARIAYAEILRAHTHDDPSAAGGVRVDYAGLRADPAWARVLRGVRETDPAQIESPAAQLAFWINAYNILALDMVARHWPVASIVDIGTLPTRVWDMPAGEVAEHTLSLDQIEHERIRPLGDPRIHAAIVCASASCPVLAREPYTAASLDARLDAAFAGFVADPSKGCRIDRAANTIHLSSIFKWFAEDFEKQGGPLAVIARHLGDDDRAWVLANGAKARLEYMEYDWRVNG